MTDPHDLTLYYAPRTRSFAVLWLLEELGLDYHLEAFSIDSGRQKNADFLALNPMGKVPLVVHQGVPVAETGAIAIYLADRFPHAGLAPALDEPSRAAYLRWILFSGSVIEPALGEHFFQWKAPPASMAWGSFAQMLAALHTGIQANPDGPWLLGDRFSAADVVLGATARFSIMFGAIEPQGPIGDYVGGLTERDAFARALAIEERESERFAPLPA